MIAIRKISVPRFHRLISQGQSVEVSIQVVSGDIAPVLTDPTEVPVISLFNPAGTALVTDQAMTFVEIGIYKYVFQTTTSNAIGAYKANITVTSLGEAARVEGVEVFKIITASTFAAFSYLVVADQNGALWYWYVVNDNTLNFLPTVPSELGKQATAISLPAVPRWLVLVNPGGFTRYVYPEVTGEPTVTATQPAVGAGHTGSPTFIALSAGSFTIALNVSDEIILQSV